MFAQHKEMNPEMRRYTERLLLSVAALVCLGLVMIFSVAAAQGVSSRSAGVEAVGWRLAWLGLGLLGMYLASRLDLKWVQRHLWLVVGLAFLLLVLVLVPGVGAARYGAHRWLAIGGRIQPSEFAKLLAVIFIAAYATHHAPRMHTFKEGLLWPGLVVVTVCGLIFLEPDYGTAILVGLVSLAMLLIAGARSWHVGLASGAALPVLGLMIVHSPHRFRRIVAFLDPWSYTSTAAYQQIQSVIALGSGGLLGKGLGASGQKYFYLPQSGSDFIFSVIGEELGFLGTAAVVALFILVLWFGMKIARGAKDRFCALLASGLTLLICVQAAIHMAVVTGSAPTKGITLPFVSMGGSSLVSCLVGIGLLLAVARHASAERPPDSVGACEARPEGTGPSGTGSTSREP